MQDAVDERTVLSEKCSDDVHLFRGVGNVQMAPVGLASLERLHPVETCVSDRLVARLGRRYVSVPQS